jgi:hypothetical protein
MRAILTARQRFLIRDYLLSTGCASFQNSKVLFTNLNYIRTINWVVIVAANGPDRNIADPCHSVVM